VFSGVPKRSAQAAQIAAFSPKNAVFNSISRSQLDDKAAIRLICLPYAGGGTASYHRWRPLVPPEIDLLPLALPGHDGRLNEPLHTDLKLLADSLAEELSRHALDRPFVLLGHSMGALLVHEIARSLRQRGRAMPRLLVLSGCRPPHTIVVREPIHGLPDDEFFAVLQERYGGIPPVVRDNAELRKLLLPALRADFQMIETYKCLDEAPLDVPMLVLGGTEDTAVSASHLMEWRRYGAQECNVRLLPGGHFFLFASGGAGVSPSAERREEPSPGLRMVLARIEQCIQSESTAPSEPSE
jgi:surfactin synthase thioesterase subunit